MEEKTAQDIQFYNNYIYLTVFLPGSVYEKLKEIKEKYGINYSNAIRMILIKKLLRESKSIDEIVKEIISG